MRQEELHAFLQEHGPMTVNQIMGMLYPDTSDMSPTRVTSKRVNIVNRLHQLEKYGMARIAGRTEGPGVKLQIWEAIA